MKKNSFLFLIAFLFCITFSYGQITLDTYGRTIFGNFDTVAKGISIIDENSSSSAIPFKILRSGNNKIYFNRDVNSGFSIGNKGWIVISSNLNNNYDSSYPAHVTIYADDSYGALDVHSPTNGRNGVLIRCTEDVNNRPLSILSRYGSSLAYIDGAGKVYSKGGYITSDLSLKSNVESIVNPLYKVMQLRGVSYDYKSDIAKTKINEIPLLEEYEKIKNISPELTLETFKQIQVEKSRRQIGVIANEVEKVIPEVVRTRSDGLKAVAYSELVGLLIEAIKEQQGLIDKLNLDVVALKGNKFMEAQLRTTTEAGGFTNIETIEDVLSNCVLSQNTPNPFTENTEINYYVSSEVKQASISIFDMQGKLLETYPAQQGQNSVVIEGAKLQAGMYLYSLIVDGQIADTKRMVLTK